MDTLPRPIATVVGSILGSYYYHHRTIEALFYECGASGDPPEGNCENKITHWLLRESEESGPAVFTLLGKVLEEFMDADGITRNLGRSKEEEQARVGNILARYGLEYGLGGRIYGAGLSAPSKALDEILAQRQIPEVEAEFDRAIHQVGSDPPAAVTAACAILEAFCKVYIEEEQLEIPNDQTLMPLWKVVSRHLGIAPTPQFEQDINKILSGLLSTVDGIACFRTHEGSAHGRSKKAYRIGARHARLAVHAAHTLTLFALETWDARNQPP